MWRCCVCPWIALGLEACPSSAAADHPCEAAGCSGGCTTRSAPDRSPSGGQCRPRRWRRPAPPGGSPARAPRAAEGEAHARQALTIQPISTASTRVTAARVPICHISRSFRRRLRRAARPYDFGLGASPRPASRPTRPEPSYEAPSQGPASISATGRGAGPGLDVGPSRVSHRPRRTERWLPGLRCYCGHLRKWTAGSERRSRYAADPATGKSQQRSRIVSPSAALLRRLGLPAHGRSRPRR
jgi:hypothetical protein